MFYIVDNRRNAYIIRIKKRARRTQTTEDGMKRFEFSKKENAFGFADKCEKMQMIILGDNGKFWVVSMAEGARLLKAGYEMAR